MEWVHVEGKRGRAVKLYALSTCGWCRKTRELLDELKIAYDYQYVDLLNGAARQEVLAEVKRWNPAGSFPTIVIDDKDCIVGFKPEFLRVELAREQ